MLLQRRNRTFHARSRGFDVLVDVFRLLPSQLEVLRTSNGFFVGSF